MDTHADHVGGRSRGRTFTGRMIALIVAAVLVIGMALILLFAIGDDGSTSREVVEPEDTGTGSLPPENTTEDDIETIPGPRGGGTAP